MIEFDSVSKSYANASQAAVDDLSLTIESSSIHVLLGESGSGKTTVLKMINRLIEPTSGEIRIDGEAIRALDPISLRRRIGYAFQGIGLFPHMSVADNVAVVPHLLEWAPDEIRARVDELLAMVGLDPSEFGHRSPLELSGGQQQRVGVARALAGRSTILLMDEPFGALDPITRDELQRELKDLQSKLGLTVVLVTHDVSEALLLADRIAVMKDGVLIADDEPDRLLSRSSDDYVQALMSMPKRQAQRLAEYARNAQGGAGDARSVD